MRLLLLLRCCTSGHPYVLQGVHFCAIRVNVHGVGIVVPDSLEIEHILPHGEVLDPEAEEEKISPTAKNPSGLVHAETHLDGRRDAHALHGCLKRDHGEGGEGGHSVSQAHVRSQEAAPFNEEHGLPNRHVDYQHLLHDLLHKSPFAQPLERRHPVQHILRQHPHVLGGFQEEDDVFQQRGANPLRGEERIPAQQHLDVHVQRKV
mmetsp:Transcript_128917/g.275142  ORF Transcript_128917/g.275142 Transcript_128917/m.275142 type:complete len:205 (-) Transcript_128917:254-868(-)